MTALLALIEGLAREFVRDRTALFFTLLFPVVFMLILGLFFSGIGGEAEYDVGVVDRDQTATSAGVVTALESVPGFLVTAVGAKAELAEIAEGNRHVVVEIAAGVGAAMEAGEEVTVRVHADPGRTSSVQVAVPIVEKVLDGFDRFRTDTPRLVQMEIVSTRGSNLRMIDFVGPGIIAMSVMQLGLFGSINLVSKREKLVLKRLGATPASRSMVLVAEVIFRLLVTVVQSAILITILVLVFDVAVNELAKLVGVLLVGALAFIGIGYAASSFARTEEAILPIVQLISLPMMFLSGIFFPIENLPEFIDPIVRVLPLTYFGDGVRQVMVGGSALNAMWLNVVVLAGWVVASFVVAVKFFKWE